MFPILTNILQSWYLWYPELILQYWQFILKTGCRKKSRITLSIKQLEEDPLLETLDKVIPQVCRVLILSFFLFWFSFSYVILVTIPSDNLLSKVYKINYASVWKLCSQDSHIGSDSLSTNGGYSIEPLPGLDAIFEELLREDGCGFITFGLVFPFFEVLNSF